MKKPKKTTVGDKAVRDFHQNGDMTWAQFIRRIDRAISAAVRKERERCVVAVRTCVSPGVLETSIIEEINRP